MMENDTKYDTFPEGLRRSLPNGFEEKYFNQDTRNQLKKRREELGVSEDPDVAYEQWMNVSIRNEWFPISVGLIAESFPCMIWEDLFGHRHYLMPFRGYCWQMCGTIKGDNDIASNEVLGLSNIMDAAYGTCRRWGSQSNVDLSTMYRHIWLEMIYGVLYRASNRGEGVYHMPKDLWGDGYCNTLIELTAAYAREY